MFSFNELKIASSNQLWLNISSTDKKKAWEQAQSHSNTLARYNAYLNHLSLYIFFNWLTEWLAEESVAKPSIFPSEDSLPSIWEVVNAAAITLGEKRIVLIPSETIDLEELCVPQEWVDIPSFAGDYYLAVQVNLEANEDECFLGVLGFTTHRLLKNFGRYNANERTYVLAAKNLTENLSVMLMTLGLPVQEEIPELFTVSEAEAHKLLQLLGNSSIYFPRLRVDVPFEQWAALLDNDEWRTQLYHRRIGGLAIAKNTASVNNLSNWFQNIFETGWQSLNTILNTESENLAFAFRQRELTVGGVSVEGVKLIDLGIQLGNHSVALLVGLTQEDEQKVGIRVQLHPSHGQTYLPPNIKLALLSSSGATLQEFQSRTQDNLIQLKRFTCPKGKTFKIQVAIDNFNITEDFVV
ncbi:hypothetical protein DP113_05190 [Brasilonema octagenarum UFV-E1]|uniref:DUF1822 family protein n=1 Tax=Brasilonema sennae CENA114 TaxID=415709 RepID=A0A856MAJ6_9CYAN|nr:DUF1822 family protein [Brasilonema sennae]QDL07384.1 hypothetical protein DP114_05240 [Brasilonema sennae CENA114]QDL13746.1 hypothetical protein DP113_05190 [Brasilonema octagenarum UFV-E1]